MGTESSDCCAAARRCGPSGPPRGAGRTAAGPGLPHRGRGRRGRRWLRGGRCPVRPPTMARKSKTPWTKDRQGGGMDVAPVPPGYTSLPPFRVVDGARAAIAFYTSVFGATVVDVMDGPDGTVAHAELDFGNGRLQLSDPNPKSGLGAAPGVPEVSHSACLYCDDVGAVVARAKEQGAVIREKVSTFVTGDR